MSVGCNYLREHVIPEARIHYAYIDAGGTAPNVVQDHATVRYEVRTPFVKDLRELFDRVVDVAKGAALMTGTTLDVDLPWPLPNMCPTRHWAPLPVKPCRRWALPGGTRPISSWHGSSS